MISFFNGKLRKKKKRENNSRKILGKKDSFFGVLIPIVLVKYTSSYLNLTK